MGTTITRLADVPSALAAPAGDVVTSWAWTTESGSRYCLSDVTGPQHGIYAGNLHYGGKDHAVEFYTFPRKGYSFFYGSEEQYNCSRIVDMFEWSPERGSNTPVLIAQLESSRPRQRPDVECPCCGEMRSPCAEDTSCTPRWDWARFDCGCSRRIFADGDVSWELPTGWDDADAIEIERNLR